jgi:hypothetical protein
MDAVGVEKREPGAALASASRGLDARYGLDAR